MNERSDVPGQTRVLARVRTALVLCGAGTAGAYQAGVLRALTEAGVKIDVVAGHGPGAGNALCAAIDGERPAVGRRRVRGCRRVCTRPTAGAAPCGCSSSVSSPTAILLLSPLLVLVAAALTYAIGLALALVNLTERVRDGGHRLPAHDRLLFNPPICRRSCRARCSWRCWWSSRSSCVAAVRAAAEERSRRRFARRRLVAPARGAARRR